MPSIQHQCLIKSFPLPSLSHASSHLFLFLWLKAPSWLGGNKTVYGTGLGMVTSSLSYLASMFLSRPTAWSSMHLQLWEGNGPPGWMREGRGRGRDLWNWCGGTVKIKQRISTLSDLFQLTDELVLLLRNMAKKGLQKEKGGFPVENCGKNKSFVSGSKQTGPKVINK